MTKAPSGLSRLFNFWCWYLLSNRKLPAKDLKSETCFEKVESLSRGEMAAVWAALDEGAQKVSDGDSVEGRGRDRSTEL